MKDNEVGFLPAIAVGTLVVFYFIWAALHDIAHANDSNLTLEYAVLALSVPGFGFLYRKAMALLDRKEKIAWLSGTGLVIALFSLGAINANLYPKYELDSLLGTLFLGAAVPVVALLAFHLVRELTGSAHPRRG